MTDAQKIDALATALVELANAVTIEVDAKPGFGGSGHLLARLTDARKTLKEIE